MNDAERSVMQTLTEAIINMHRSAVKTFPELGPEEHIRIMNVTNGLIGRFMKKQYREEWEKEMRRQLAAERGPRPSSLILPEYYRQNWRNN